MVSTVDGVSYSAFVAPSLLAASCMNGAVTDGLFNIYFKLHFQKTYDGVLATPMRVPDVAFGEMLWALARSSLYAAGFLIVLLASSAWSDRPLIRLPIGLLALPGAVLAAASFVSIALCATSFIRTIQDFDLVVGLGVMPMFLFSGTFFPVSRMPDAIEWIVYTLPLYHGVGMLRQLTTGIVGPGILVHIVYLLIVGTIAFAIAMHRLERALIK
jgi:lipooligosaccharide transport system permease protein